ncbi:hypothetical protein CIK05_04455 [Bdellovibrio sp. qaytius]|nr:hypothetical protein CIK05_04455 [Bdellovibrio sp. qaytius]
MKVLTLLALLLTSVGHAESLTPDLIQLDGQYEMQLDINGTVFKDIMVLQGKDQPMTLNNFKGPLAGTIEVTGMFKSSLEGVGSCNLDNSTCAFDFFIIANENTQSFKVIYKMQLEQNDFTKLINGETKQIRLTGTAYLEDGSELGKFVATK